MLTVPTLEKMRSLKLCGMATAFEEQLNSESYRELTFEERLGLLIDREITYRNNRRLRSCLKRARLRQQACIEDIDFRHHRELDKQVILSLATCQWIRDHLNVLITGPTGIGKTFIACALGQRACLEGLKVMYYRASKLFKELFVSRGDGSYNKLMNTIAKTHLIIIDDWGLCALGDQEQMDLLEILEDRHQIHATIIAAQLPVEHWHQMIGNPTIADAVMDRLVNSSYKINLKGESMRKKKSG